MCIRDRCCAANTPTTLSLGAGDPLPHASAHGPEFFIALHLVQDSGEGVKGKVGGGRQPGKAMNRVFYKRCCTCNIDATRQLVLGPRARARLLRTGLPLPARQSHANMAGGLHGGGETCNARTTRKRPHNVNAHLGDHSPQMVQMWLNTSADNQSAP